MDTLHLFPVALGIAAIVGFLVSVLWRAVTSPIGSQAPGETASEND